LGDRRKREFILCAAGATQSQPAESENAFQVREQHLDTLAVAPGLLERLGTGECASDIASILVDIARDHACWSVRAALGLEGTRAARNFARVYAAKRGRTPAKTVEAIRVDAARRRLEETDDRIESIAEGCGFSSEEQMRCAFLRILRIPPRDYRKRFS
jgi:Helix-turn-helix domain